MVIPPTPIETNKTNQTLTKPTTVDQMKIVNQPKKGAVPETRAKSQNFQKLKDDQKSDIRMFLAKKKKLEIGKKLAAGDNNIIINKTKIFQPTNQPTDETTNPNSASQHSDDLPGIILSNITKRDNDTAKGPL